MFISLPNEISFYYVLHKSENLDEIKETFTIKNGKVSHPEEMIISRVLLQ